MDELRDRLAGLEEGRRPTRRRRRSRRPATLAELGGVVRDDGVLVVERRAELLVGREEADLHGAFGAACGQRATDLDSEIGALLADPEGALFVDTETTGLAGSMVFLLGTMQVLPDGMLLRQVFARDYREEAALLSKWTEKLEQARLLVSFNGKSFDLPVLRDRLGYHRIAPPEEPAHVDLLHHARRRWVGVLPDCRLQTLEWHLCGRRRVGDIPGEEIPGVYHHFVRTGATSDILNVFHHNALDLITLAGLALKLAEAEEGKASAAPEGRPAEVREEE